MKTERKFTLRPSTVAIIEGQGIESQTTKKKKRWLHLERAGISVVIVIIVALLSLPVVFFYIPMSQTTNSMQENNTSVAGEQCASAVPYSGSVCRDELLSMTECFPDDSLTTDLLVMTDSSAMQAQQFIGALELFGSVECVAAATPFLCVYLFGGVCDGQDVLYLPTAQECEEISTGVCQAEWELARNVGMEFVNCSILPNSLPSLCFNSSLGLETEDEESNSGSGSNTCTMSCRENFFCNETTLRCLPQCPDWNLFSTSATRVRDGLILTTAVIGLVAGTGVLIVSCLRWSKVYVFPSVFVIYQTVNLMILNLLHVITYFDRSSLYCTSESLLESILNTTSFCVVSGIVLHYFLLQISLWWVLHMAVIFWKVHFPMRAHSKSTQHHKLVHALFVTVTLLLPVASVVAPIIDNALKEMRTDQPVPGTLGFGYGLFPPILCSGLNSTITFYTVILPNVVLVIFGTVTLVLTIWKIHKTQGFFRSNRRQSKSAFFLSTAEKKLLIVFWYYIILKVIGYVTFSLNNQAIDTLQTELISYFLCEQNGHDPETPCSRAGFENLINPGVTILSFCLTMLAPAVNFVFVVDYQEVKQKLRTMCGRK